MNRRNFIRSSLAATFTASSFSFANNTATETIQAINLPDLVAVKNGEPAQMLDKALEAMNGISTFVKAGQRVCIKPNIGWNKTPEMAANTNPQLIKRLVEQCIQAGAKEVVVFDHTCHNWTDCYQNSGIEKAAKEAGAVMAPGNDEKYYHEVEIPGAKVLKTAKVHESILESDVFINVPIIKHHRSARMTISIKNLMGAVWDRKYWHKTDLNQCIADYGLFHKKPTLNIVDGYRTLKRFGPMGKSEEDVANTKCLLLSRDMIAVDTAAAKIFGTDIAEIGYLGLAEELGVGTTDLSKLQIKRISC